MRGARHTFLVATLALLISGCGFVHDERLVGPYRLVAMDVASDMSICFSLPDGNCVGDGLPGPTVFSAGFNDKYLVAAVHPETASGGPDWMRTDYYYVIRSSVLGILPRNGTIGPFDQKAFAAETARLRLPGFTRTFDNLK